MVGRKSTIVKTKRFVGWILVVLCVAALTVSGCTSKVETELTLKDYPRLFKEDTMIVIGQYASEIEQESAADVAIKLKELTGNKPVIKRDTDVSLGDKADHNLIIVGMPNSNSLLSEVSQTTEATEVTSEHPGEDKGILEILKNPGNIEKVLLIVAGSNEQGVRAASILITYNDRIAKLEGKTMITPFEDRSSAEMTTRTVPSGYLELTVSPAEVYSGVGEEVEIRCAIYSLVNTPVEITSVELVVFDSDRSLLREQAMTKDSYWSAHTAYTIVGDEAYYRLKVNFTTPYAEPEEYSEYTADSFPIVVSQKGG